MSYVPINGAPLVIDYGTQDLSPRRIPRFTATPQHVAKFWIYAQKGSTKELFSSPNNLAYLYGDNTLKENSKYFNHQTLFMKRVAAAGNSVKVKRLLPPDVGPKANVILYLDVLETTVDLYELNSDGSIRLDSNNTPVIIGTAPGIKAKWVVGHRSSRADQDNFGLAQIVDGDQIDVGTNQVSKRYPILEVEASWEGEWYNNIGFKLRAPNRVRADSGYFYSKVYEESKVFPYIANVVQRMESGRVLPRPDMMGSMDLFFSFKPGVTDETGYNQLDLETRMVLGFSSKENSQFEDIESDIGRVHVYSNNVQTIVEMAHAAELDYIDHNTEFGADPSEAHKFNIVTGLRPNGTPYRTFQLVDAPNSFSLGNSNIVYLRGAFDGTMNDEIFAQQVADEMYDYLDPQSDLMDVAYHIESVIYDSGFPIDTKYELCNIIAVRKDTQVVLSTNVAGETYTDRNQELAVGAALKSYVSTFPESDYFNTPVSRATIVSGTGRVRNSSYKLRVPLTYELAAKSAAYMGAGNGAWVPGRNYDGAPGSIINEMIDLSNPWVPAYQRNTFWQIGINWAMRYDRNNFYFPAIKTVYFDDTSVLNSHLTVAAICYLNKLSHAAHREFSGVSNLSGAQLIERVNEFYRTNVKGKFDGRFVIVPDAHLTDMDILRGYSWTLAVKIYAPNMRTVMTTYIQSYRIEDFGTVS
jgi:hypothetical protein